MGLPRALLGLPCCAFFVAALAETVSCAEGEPSGRAECDASSLLQRASWSRGRDDAELALSADQLPGWPDVDVGNLGAAISGAADAATRAVGGASDAVSDAATGALSMVATAVNKSLVRAEAATEEYQRRMNESAVDVKRGVASMIERALNMTAAAPSDEHLEAVAQEGLQKSAAAWAEVSRDVKAAAATIQSMGMGISGNFAESINASFAAAQSGCDAFAETLASITSTLRNVSSLANVNSSTHDTGAGAVFPIMPSLDVALAQRVALTTKDAPEVLAQLNDTLREAGHRADDFAASFKDAFQNLTRAVSNATQDMMTTDSLSTLHGTFRSLTASAEHLAARLVDGSAQLLHSVEEGVAATGIEAPKAQKSAGLCRRPCFWLGALSILGLFGFSP